MRVPSHRTAPWPEATVESFADTPPPCFVQQRPWGMWRHGERHIGLAIWSDLEVREIRAYMDLHLQCARRVGRPLMVFIDFRSTPSHVLSAKLLEAVYAIVRELGPLIDGTIERHAYVCSPGWMRPFWLGINDSVGMGGVEPACFDDPHTALAWLGAEPEVGHAVPTLTEVMLSRSRVVAELEVMLMVAPGLELEEAARRVGRSRRSLQRDLSALGEPWLSLRRRVRITRAQELLRTTDDKIETIAREVGFATSRQFFVAFQEVVGTTPSGFRDKARRAS